MSNVGPKTAIAVLSALPGPELARAIAHKDVARLTGISGIGKKTAERLVLELRDKLQPRAGRHRPAPVPAALPRRATSCSSARSSNMGYRQAEAERAVGALGDESDSAAAAISSAKRWSCSRE